MSSPQPDPLSLQSPSASPLLSDDVLRSVAGQAAAGPAFWVYMATSGVLAAVAMLSDSVPILIGAMVVAPALAPLVLVPVAAVAGQWRLAGKGLGTALAGLGVAVVLALATTWLMNTTGVLDAGLNLLDKPLLEERVRPGWWSLAAAVAAGVAGTVAQPTSKTDTLVGAVAALALVPAGAAAAIALASGDPSRALGAAILMGVNIAVIIAMGMLTLLVVSGRSGLRPALLVPVVLFAGVVALLWAVTHTGLVPAAPATAQDATASAALTTITTTVTAAPSTAPGAAPARPPTPSLLELSGPWPAGHV